MTHPPRSTPALRRLAGAWLLLAGLAGVGGCSNRFTRERYETIWRGQPQRAVRTKLGKPDQVRRDAWFYVHRRPFYSAAILFERGEVSGKLWSFERTISAEEIRAHREAQAPAEPKPKPPVRRKPR